MLGGHESSPCIPISRFLSFLQGVMSSQLLLARVASFEIGCLEEGDVASYKGQKVADHYQRSR